MKTTPKGFTLIELIVVIAIIGLSSTVAIPNLIHYIPSPQFQTVPNVTSPQFQTAPNVTSSQLQSYLNQTAASINRLNVPPPTTNIITGSSTVPNCLTDLGSTAPSYTTPNLTVPSYTGSSSTAPSSTVPNCTGSSSAVP